MEKFSPGQGKYSLSYSIFCSGKRHNPQHTKSIFDKFQIDPLKLEKTSYEHGFALDDGSDKENYPSRIAFEQNDEKKSPKNMTRRKDKPKPKPNPVVDLSENVRNVSSILPVSYTHLTLPTIYSV